MSKPNLSELLERKNVRFGLAALCLLFALQGLYVLIVGQSRAAVLSGGGQLLLWGAWAVINALKPYGKTVPGLNIAMNVGLVLIVASWVMK